MDKLLTAVIHHTIIFHSFIIETDARKSVK